VLQPCVRGRDCDGYVEKSLLIGHAQHDAPEGLAVQVSSVSAVPERPDMAHVTGAGSRLTRPAVGDRPQTVETTCRGPCVTPVPGPSMLAQVCGFPPRLRRQAVRPLVGHSVDRVERTRTRQWRKVENLVVAIEVRTISVD